MIEIGERVPDFAFLTETLENRSLASLCPGAAILIFLRHLA